MPTVAPGRRDVVTDSGATTVIDNSCVAVIAGLPESVTCTVKAELPAAVGVPEITPVEAFSDSPAGSDPAPGTTDQLYGAVPPVAASVAEYPAPTVAPGSTDVVTDSGASTVIDNGCVAVIAGLLESVTCTVKADLPAAVGVPEITPVEAFSDSPAGSDPAPGTTDQLYGAVPPVAAK